jgi:ABC-type multidrug transport system fused ATPase/permease subunit
MKFASLFVALLFLFAFGTTHADFATTSLERHFAFDDKLAAPLDDVGKCEDAEAEASDDAALLQTVHQMEVVKSTVLSARTEAKDRAPMCSGHTVLDLLSYRPGFQVATLPSIGNFTIRRDCTPHPTMLTEIDVIRARQQQAASATKSYVLLACFGVIFLAYAFYMWRTVVWPSTDNSYIESSRKTRPEEESWKRGLICWLTMDWVSPWIKYWGTASSDETKIDHGALGFLGFADDEAARCADVMEKLWDEQAPKKTRFDIIWVVLRYVTYRKLAFAGLCSGIWQFLMFVGPALAIRETIKLLKNVQMMYALDPSFIVPADFFARGLQIIGTFLGGGLVMFVTDMTMFLMLNRMSIRLRSGLNSFCFRKSQRMHGSVSEFEIPAIASQMQGTRMESGVAKYSFVALMNQDVNTGMNSIFLQIFNMMFHIPLLFLVIFLMSHVVKRAIIVTLCVLVGLVILILFAGYLQAMKGAFAGMWFGQRIILCRELFQAIRIVKAYAWEDAAFHLMSKARTLELEYLASVFRWTGFAIFWVVSTDKIVFLSTIIAYVAMYGDIGAIELFTMMQLLRCFTQLIGGLVTIIPALCKMYPSIVRLNAFLHLPESNKWLRLRHSAKSGEEANPPQSPVVLPLDQRKIVARLKGNFAWDPSLGAYLKDIDLEVRDGELLAIVGEVGAGKTALITALLGEMILMKGAELKSPTKIGYHSQVPVIAEGSLHDNIIFWRDVDQSAYEQVIDDASLKEDLKYLPGGDCIGIGHQGVALSGGQRARVSLARMAYTKNVDLMLMDDPYSSVDTHTADHLEKNLLLGARLQGKARVVVTQPDVDRLRCFDRVIVVGGGKILAQGSPTEIQEYECFQNLQQQAKEVLVGDAERKGRGTKKPGKAKSTTPRKEAEAAMQVREEEAQGRAGWETIKYFLKLGGIKTWVMMIVFYILWTIAGMMVEITLAQWGSAEMHFVHKPKTFILGCLFWLCVACVIFIPFWYCATTWALNVSHAIFGIVAKNLLAAPIDKFFDKNPLGRILNRLSGDMMAIDYSTNAKILGTLQIIFSTTIPTIYMHSCIPVWVTLASVPFYVVIYNLILRYWNLQVPLRYLGATTRSKMSSYISDSAGMRSVLRAYGVADRVSSEQAQAVDQAMKCDMAINCSRKWVILRLGYFYLFFLTSILLLLLWFPNMLPVGIAGLLTTYMCANIIALEMNLEQASGLQFELVNMDRVYEYTNLPSEKPARMPQDSQYATFFVKTNRIELGSLQAIRQSGKIQIVRGPQIIFEECDNGKAFQLAKDARWSDIWARAKTTEDPLSGATSKHRLVAVGASLVNDPQDIAKQLVNGTTEDLTLSLQTEWLEHGAEVKVTNLVAGYANHPAVLKGLNFEIEAMTRAAIMARLDVASPLSCSAYYASLSLGSAVKSMLICDV